MIFVRLVCNSMVVFSSKVSDRILYMQVYMGLIMERKKASIREPVIDRGPVIDHFLVFVSLFNRNICSNSFSCPDFMYLVLPQKLK